MSEPARSSHQSPHPSFHGTTDALYTPDAHSLVRLPDQVHRRLTLIRQSDPAADLRPTPGQRERLLDQLTSRDIAILSALLSYRYLDRGHVQHLFFSGTRRSQARVNWLRREHLVRQWTAIQSPGWRRLDSVLLLSSRGAVVLSAARGEDPAPALRRSLHARDHSAFLVHDLEANGFFVGLAAAAALLPDAGLYHWVGEAACRDRFAAWGAPVAPDGWGRYLTARGEVTLMLEWDRGTEPAKRLRSKLRGYVRCFAGDGDAHLNHVLVVTPTEGREAVVREAIESVVPRSAAVPSCRFWTASQRLLAELGHLGPVWSDGGADRRSLPTFEMRARSARRVEDCIAKPQWWERRPGGGEGA